MGHFRLDSGFHSLPGADHHRPLPQRESLDPRPAYQDLLRSIFRVYNRLRAREPDHQEGLAHQGEEDLAWQGERSKQDQQTQEVDHGDPEQFRLQEGGQRDVDVRTGDSGAES